MRSLLFNLKNKTMKVFKVTADILHDEQNFPVDFNCGAFGEGDSLEWHESLDLQLAKFNNVKVTEKVDKGTVIECCLFMGKLPKKEYKKYRKEHEKEGYSEIAENNIDYDWTIITSKKFKL